MNKFIYLAFIIIIVIGKKVHNQQLTPYYYDTRQNLALNGHFQAPDQKGKYAILTLIPGWKQINQEIQIGLGTIYNPAWKDSGQVIQLDARRNSVLSQTYVFDKPGLYQLIFDHAARSNHLNTSNQMSVWWNSKQVGRFKVSDLNIHSQTIIINTTVITNKLQFKGEGPSDGYGHTIDHIRLYKGYHFSTSNNYVKNANFQNPTRGTGKWAISAVNSWIQQANQIETGDGSLYNPLWKTGQILELDAKHNSVVNQTLQLAAGIYLLEFQCASRKGISQQSNKFSVYFNGKLLKTYIPTDYQLHTQRFIVTVTPYATLSFKGEGTSDSFGQGIDNVALYKAI